jgi:prevent-host-death family protein
MGRPRRVGVRELRQNLSVYLRGVAKGKTYEVTDRGHPVAVLAPLPGRSTLLDRLAAEGKLTRGRGDLGDLGPAPSLRLEPSLTELLQESREEG